MKTFALVLLLSASLFASDLGHRVNFPNLKDSAVGDTFTLDVTVGTALAGVYTRTGTGWAWNIPVGTVAVGNFPAQSGHANQLLTTDGSNAAWSGTGFSFDASSKTLTVGSTDLSAFVTGPALSTLDPSGQDYIFGAAMITHVNAAVDGNAFDASIVGISQDNGAAAFNFATSVYGLELKNTNSGYGVGVGGETIANLDVAGADGGIVTGFDGRSHNNSATHKVLQLIGYLAGSNDEYNAGTPPGATQFNAGFYSDPQHDRAPINSALYASKLDDITSGTHIAAAFYSVDQGSAVNNYLLYGAGTTAKSQIPSLILAGAAPTAPASTVAIGGTTAASSNCGSLTGFTACLVINVSGTPHYIPYK